MSTLPNPAPVTCPSGADWMPCAGCGALFPASPGQDRCRRCTPSRPPGRCAAAHPEDHSPCDGSPDAVRVVDQVGDQLSGCVHHASVALASIENVRVYPSTVEGAAIEAYRRAQLRTPFEFDPEAPWPASDHSNQWRER